jgi:tetratricopeptide (TPR) repeat protein
MSKHGLGRHLKWDSFALKTLRIRLATRLEAGLNARSLAALEIASYITGAALFGLGLVVSGTLRTFAWAAAWALVVMGMVAHVVRPHVEARLYIRKCHRLIMNGQFREALKAAEQAVVRVPYLASAYIARSAAFTGLGYLDMAVDDAEQAIRMAPRLPEARMARARIYSYRGLHEDAIYDLRKALRERPDWAVGYIEIARMYIKLQDYENSLAALHDLHHKNPPPTLRYDAHVLAGWLYEDKLKDLDRAIASYTRAIPILPDRKIGYLRRALAYRERGDLLQYAEDLLRAAQREPTPEDTGQYHWLRASCYKRRYQVTRDPQDMAHWLMALEHSAREDATQYRIQARQWLESLRAEQNGHHARFDAAHDEGSFPPRPRFSLN